MLPDPRAATARPRDARPPFCRRKRAGTRITGPTRTGDSAPALDHEISSPNPRSWSERRIREREVYPTPGLRVPPPPVDKPIDIGGGPTYRSSRAGKGHDYADDDVPQPRDPPPFALRAGARAIEKCTPLFREAAAASPTSTRLHACTTGR